MTCRRTRAHFFAAPGKTVVLVTHDFAEAAFLASRLVLQRESRVPQVGGYTDFRERLAHPFVNRFMRSGRAPGARSVGVALGFRYQPLCLSRPMTRRRIQ